MKQAALAVRRSSLQFVGVLVSTGTLVTAFAACAAAPVDDDPGGAVSETNKAETAESSSVLPPSNPPKQQTDAGTAPKKDSGTAQKDASAPPAQDSGTSGSGTGGSCDPNDFVYMIKAFDEASKSSPRTCGAAGGTCKSTECCFDAYGVCVDL